MIEANDKATEYYSELLLKSSEALDYLKSRGLYKQVLIDNKIGFANEETSIIGLLKANNLPYEHLATLDGKTDYFKNRIIMPLISLGHTRLFTSRGMPGKLPKHLHQRGKIEYFYNEDVLFGAKYVLVCESPICCLTLKQNGINAIARLGNRNGDLSKIDQSTEVYIVPDIDSHRAGEKEAIKFGAILGSLGHKKIKIVYLSDDYSEKTDINSFFLKKNIADLRALVKSAVNIRDHKPCGGLSFAQEVAKIINKKLKSTKEVDFGSSLNHVKSLKIEDEIKRYCSIIEYGNVYKCLCPFHTDSTPSLTIYPDSKSWFCFSCNIGGDIIEFVKRMEEVDFAQAIQLILGKQNEVE